MIACPNPSCRKPLPALARTCSYCQADLSLLVEYVDELQAAVDRAQTLTRAGKLAEAIWAYLEVLDVDPYNPPARRQVSQVAAAVRNFDRTAATRRFRDPELESRSRGLPNSWLAWLAFLLIGVLAFFAGYQLGINTR
jgi:hypothetical protein